MGGLPKPLQGTGGVRSPAGPYGPPGFVGGLPGSLPVGAADNAPRNSLTGGVGTTMQPNATNTGGPPPGYIGIPWGEYGTGGWVPPQTGGLPYQDTLYRPDSGIPQQTGGLQPNMASQGPTPGPSPTNGPRLPPIPPGTHPMVAENWGFLHSQPSAPRAGTPEWFNSPQGMNAQAALAQRGTYGMGPGTLGTAGQHPAARDYRADGQNVAGGLTRQQAAAQSQANWANPDWRMQQVLGGSIAPTNNAEMQAMIANMSPADRDAYLAKYRSIGLDPTFQGGGGTGPFGN